MIMKRFGFVGNKRKSMTPDWVEYTIATILAILALIGVFVFIWFCSIVLQIQHL